MKKHLLKTAVLLILISFTAACTKKDDCPYVIEEKVVVVPPVNCVDSPFAGYMVVTFSEDIPSQSAMILNPNMTYNAPIGTDWFDPALGALKLPQINTPQWSIANIGTVFGIALDNSNGIYLSASNIYAENGFVAGVVGSPGGSAGIYYTNFLTPTITSTLVKTAASSSANTVGTSTIPNTGTGLNSIGNIAFDKVNNQLFATNLEDGRIYRINASTGVVLSIFDPFVIDNGIAGIAPAAEQLWGVGVLTSSGVTSVYFAKSYNNSSKEVWSVSLDSTGEFMATQIGSSKLFNDSASSSKLQIAYSSDSACKITDIAFSSSGKILLAERGHAHRSKVFEFVKTGLIWGPANNFFVGGNAVNAGQNCAGGVDYGNRKNNANNTVCDDVVWASGNYMPFSIPGLFVYGLQGIKASGNSSTVSNNQTTDLYIDYNHSYTTNDKGGIGDVEIVDSKCNCL